MATRIHGVIACRWTRTATLNDQEISSLVTPRSGNNFADITGQPDNRISSLAANVYLCEVDVVPATATEINALPGVIVLANETYDDQTGVVSSGNFDTAPTGAQLTALGTQLKARFPGLTDQLLQNAGQAILRAGLTRRQIIALLAQNFQGL